MKTFDLSVTHHDSFAGSVLSCSLWLTFNVMLINTFLTFVCCCCLFVCLQSTSFIQTLWIEQATFTLFVSLPKMKNGLFLLTSRAVVFLLALLVYLCVNWKRGAEYAPGVSRPCYSCNISYVQWILYIACTVCSHVREPALHMFRCPRSSHLAYVRWAAVSAEQRLCDTYTTFSAVDIFINC